MRGRYIALGLALVCCVAGCAREYVAGSKDYRVTLITTDQIDLHWMNVNIGVRAAISDLEKEGYHISYNWYAPDKKDTGKQIEQIDMAASNQSDLILLAVNDPTACNAILREVGAEGVKVIYIDSPATYKADATFATDNYAAGVSAGKEMLTLLAQEGVSEGVIGIVSAQAGVQACIDRVDGFLAAIADSPFTPSEVQYSDGEAIKAQELATNLINNGIVGLFGVNEGSSIGCGNAARDASRRIHVVGFDNSSAIRTMVANGTIYAFIAQNPFVMGYEAMQAAAEALDGKDWAGAFTDTGSTVVKKDNLSDFA